jgi:hypothetical protein
MSVAQLARPQLLQLRRWCQEAVDVQMFARQSLQVPLLCDAPRLQTKYCPLQTRQVRNCGRCEESQK